MSDGEYSEDAIKTITAVIDRKKNELVELDKKKSRVRKAEKLEGIDKLIAYINADIASYIAVLADMKDDESLLEGIDLEDLDEVDRPECYDRYMKTLGEEAAELDEKASEIRADHCDMVMETIGQEMGEKALKSGKMIKIMLDDPYMLSVIGETIFYDDKLYEEFSKLFDMEEPDKKKGKSKKKGKKKSKKGKK
ncbi:MAG: hypothetical protein IKM91_09180 [Candidatus Methanomethylophilaceae archaeon]|jgi:hypothetical protein|nr:hypothetical protein [Candidatus Methanomethylophilaceae archaeon]MBR2093110.1 hypothetical protein [Candidatus Methanomethylophilaceae archaeon]MBR3475585.1 hypothetical protein [Candidatus Methanomethylophilaceae archaeon]MBR4181653.1 hypothetical protein [Candidatus Methanomethylophilaceae archaeon]MBR4696980.1 hypothetical protein [Candidatus Methanomethylophilaceae archaeon]